MMSEEKTYARVVITGVDMPFGALVKLMIRLSLASIPAVIIISLLSLLVGVLISFLMAMLGFGLW
jgi:hypothetical protein